MGASDLARRPPRIDHRAEKLAPEPGGGAREPRYLNGGLGERADIAGRLIAELAPLGPDNLRSTGYRDISGALEPARVHPRGDHPKRGTPRRITRLHRDRPATLGQVGRLDHAVSGPVEDGARSVPLRTRRLVHARGPLAQWIFPATPIPAEPRALTPLRRARPHHHQT